MIVDKFLKRVFKTKRCWFWTGWIHKKSGRGYFYKGCGEYVFAHRYAYEQFVGPIPIGMYVLHTCDNPCCVNPSHLFVGTQGDNMADMKDKGRVAHQRGEINGRAKLTQEEANVIRSSYRFRHPLYGQKGLAKKYNLSVISIQQILYGNRYKNP